MKLAPVGLPERISDVELLQGNNIMILRGGSNAGVEWEEGVAFDKRGARLFFIFHKPINTLSFKCKVEPKINVNLVILTVT